jgi:hypothetical protein
LRYDPVMASKGWCFLCAAALLLWLAFGLPLHGIGADASTAATVGVPMMLDCESCDPAGEHASCTPAWCVLCPVLLPTGLVMPAIGTAILPARADERGQGLALRPPRPPPRRLLRA